MSPEEMIERTRQFSIRAMRLCEALPNRPDAWHIKSQLSRCAGSTAANYRAALRGRSKAEFSAKLGIVEEEADESCHWLQTVIDADLLPAARVQPLLDEASEITAIIVSSLKTAKGRRRPQQTHDSKQSAIRNPKSEIPRIGHGYDLHRLEPGRDLIVGGLKLEHDRGCDAHSDGDVLYHAVTDAILGALGQDDIGQLFPDDDPRWQDADSAIFLHEAFMRMSAEGYAIGNLDCTVILQRPKLGPHKPEIKANLASLLGCAVSQVNLKAKTHEGVDA
ncbi:MAG: 2-C-methyl-D-erythritol 2,4-cyclodiphosphate synthase, partial [Phycisphaeraceae bacterium]